MHNRKEDEQKFQSTAAIPVFSNDALNKGLGWAYVKNSHAIIPLVHMGKTGDLYIFKEMIRLKKHDGDQTPFISFSPTKIDLARSKLKQKHSQKRDDQFQKLEIYFEEQNAAFWHAAIHFKMKFLIVTPLDQLMNEFTSYLDNKDNKDNGVGGTFYEMLWLINNKYRFEITAESKVLATPTEDTPEIPIIHNYYTFKNNRTILQEQFLKLKKLYSDLTKKSWGIVRSSQNLPFLAPIDVEKLDLRPHGKRYIKTPPPIVIPGLSAENKVLASSSDLSAEQLSAQSIEPQSSKSDVPPHLNEQNENETLEEQAIESHIETALRNYIRFYFITCSQVTLDIIKGILLELINKIKIDYSQIETIIHSTLYFTTKHINNSYDIAVINSLQLDMEQIAEIERQFTEQQEEGIITTMEKNPLKITEPDKENSDKSIEGNASDKLLPQSLEGAPKPIVLPESGRPPSKPFEVPKTKLTFAEVAAKIGDKFNASKMPQCCPFWKSKIPHPGLDRGIQMSAINKKNSSKMR